MRGRTRGYDIAAVLRTGTADKVAWDDAARVVERWNKALAAGRDMWWWSPTRADCNVSRAAKVTLLFSA
jgi:hypothetical protein